MTDQEKIRTGRRALFTGVKSEIPQEECIPISGLADIIDQINEDGEVINEQISPIFAPIIEKIRSLSQKADNADAECRKLTDQLLKSDDFTSGLKEENRQLSSEREMYLNDLITSHTEFDRALEIFQYHEVPMVLTGPENSIHDANDAFCTMFSISRSDITSSHPPLSQYLISDTNISGPDGEEYIMITLTPPIVPFDHEAISLQALIKTSLIQDAISKVSQNDAENKPDEQKKPDSPDLTISAFELFPIPAAIINNYRTVINCNNAFARLVARGKEIIYHRDIGSCGIVFPDNNCFDEVFSENTPKQWYVTVTHPDGNEVTTYLEIIPIKIDSENTHALIICVETGNEDESSEKSDDYPDTGNPSDETLLRILLDLNPSATALLDSNARIISSNEGFTEITGLSPGDLLGTDVRDLGIPIPEAVFFSGATDAQYLPGTIRIQSAWGMQESSGMVVPTGSTTSEIVAILVLQPIGEPVEIRTTPEPVLVTSKEISLPDFDTIPIPHLRTDFSGRIIKANNAFMAMTGAEVHQIEGHLRDDIVNSDSDGLMKIKLPTGDFKVREIFYQASDDIGQKEYWYYDLSAEVEKRNELELRIQALETENNNLKTNQQSASLSQKEINSDQIDIVEFELNEERYAIDITMVREVVEMLPITPLPRTPPYVIGIINLRGEVTHVIDLAILLGQRPKKDRSGQKIIIIPSDVTRGDHVAIIVDNVQSVTEIQGRHVSLLGEDITTQIRTHIKGIIKITHDDVLDKHTEVSRKATLVIWLDIQKILDGIQGAL